MSMNLNIFKEFKDKSGRRIVDGIFNFASNKGQNYRLYEDEYKAIRGALEEMRSENQPLFRKAVNHIVGAVKISKEDENAINKKLSKTAVGLDSEVFRKVVEDWHKDSSSFLKDYEPLYMLDGGQPLRTVYVEHLARIIEEAREKGPEVARALDAFFTKGKEENFMYPKDWLKDNMPETYDIRDNKGTYVPQTFESYVQSFQIYEFNWVKEIVKKNPYKEPQTELEETLEV